MGNLCPQSRKGLHFYFQVQNIFERILSIVLFASFFLYPNSARHEINQVNNSHSFPIPSRILLSLHLFRVLNLFILLQFFAKEFGQIKIQNEP